LPTLALDTATPCPSLALVEAGEAVAELWLGRERDGGRRVLQAVHALLTGAALTPGDIDGVIVGVGPGGFTGLRIGVATALGLGQALGVPVTGASSLEALALGIGDEAGPGALAAPVIDARRREVFAGAWRVARDDTLEEVVAPAAWAPARLAAALSSAARGDGPAWLAGDGLEAAGRDLSGPLLRRLPAGAPAQRLRAANLWRRVAAGGAQPAVPAYLRLPDAEERRRSAAAEAAA
jgi:tRNA threonylcarbamoyladenosine biosynthesis protein TsaB